MKWAGLKRIDEELLERIRHAQADLRDHAKAPRETRYFLAGVIDGLKQAKYVVAQCDKKQK